MALNNPQEEEAGGRVPAQLLAKGRPARRGGGTHAQSEGLLPPLPWAGGSPHPRVAVRAPVVFSGLDPASGAEHSGIGQTLPTELGGAQPSSPPSPWGCSQGEDAARPRGRKQPRGCDSSWPRQRLPEAALPSVTPASLTHRQPLAPASAQRGDTPTAREGCHPKRRTPVSPKPGLKCSPRSPKIYRVSLKALGDCHRGERDWGSRAAPGPGQREPLGSEGEGLSTQKPDFPL